MNHAFDQSADAQMWRLPEVSATTHLRESPCKMPTKICSRESMSHDTLTPPSMPSSLSHVAV